MSQPKSKTLRIPPEPDAITDTALSCQPRAKKTATEKKPRRRGRPIEKPMAELIPDTPENIARAVVNTKPKKTGHWKYLKKRRA